MISKKLPGVLLKNSFRSIVLLWTVLGSVLCILFPVQGLNKIYAWDFFSSGQYVQYLDSLNPEFIEPGTQKAVYLTGYSSMTSKSFREKIYKIIDETELNSIVFDVKDDSGFIDYDCSLPEAMATGAVKN